MFFAYILQSLRDGTYYYGSTSDLKKRVRDHNMGKVKFTKGHRPYQLHYSEEFQTKSEAILRERFFKSIDGYKWLRESGVIERK